jgi:3,5-epimerase/4-reductase
MSSFATVPPSEHVYLLFGKNGWIGGKLIELLTQQGKKFYLADSRNYDRGGVLAEVEKYKPTHILNASGVTGRPNVDWCEDHKLETIRTNVIGTLTIADICAEKGIHHLLYATGCIFEYDDVHVIGGRGFTEDDPEDKPNFHGSFYSHTKVSHFKVDFYILRLFYIHYRLSVRIYSETTQLPALYVLECQFLMT